MAVSVAAVWLATIALDTLGQLSFKAVAATPEGGEGFARWRYLAKRPQLWLGIACYVGEFLTWTAFLSLVPLGRGVLLGSLNIVAIMLAGRYFFRERLTRMRLVGIGLVSVGVAVVGMSQ